MSAEVEHGLYRTREEIETLLRDFETCALPRPAWTHAAHLTVALCYLLRHPPDAAADLIRSGIKRFNRAHGIETTPTGGYHETLTLFWIHVVRRHLEESADADERALVALANNLVRRYGRSGLPFEYYTRARLFSPEARAAWVEPDLKPLR